MRQCVVRMRLLSVFAAAMMYTTASPFDADTAKWRAEREARLKAPDGWLSVAGLFWLTQGRNEAGSGTANTVKLPARAPAHIGTFTLKGETVRFEPKPGVPTSIDGKPAGSTILKSDNNGEGDTVEVSGLKLMLIYRGERFGIRLKDNESEYRKNFQGLSWFPPKPGWVVNGRFVTYPKERTMLFDLQTGDKEAMISPGYVEFERGGRKYRLTPVQEGKELFFIFRDKTAGKTTYPAARFLYTELPENGRVTLDFNRAYNPPCVFTPYATCPLPPPENRLQISVDAGEMMYKGQH